MTLKESHRLKAQSVILLMRILKRTMRLLLSSVRYLAWCLYSSKTIHS